MERGHIVDFAAEGRDGLHLTLTVKCEVIVADRMLPWREGLNVIDVQIRRLRGRR